MARAAPVLVRSASVLADKGDPLRDAAIARLRLDGKRVDAKIADAITDGPWERTIDGAPTLTLDVLDPEGELLDSGIFSRAVRLDVASARDPDEEPMSFMLATIGGAGTPHLTLGFEDADVYALKRKTKPRKAYRGKTTRAEFLLTLVREIKGLRFWSPELHVYQPVGKVRKQKDVDARAKKGQQKHGLSVGDLVRVKKHLADRSQIRVLNTVCATGEDMNMTKTMLIGAVMCVIQESGAQNLRGGDADSVGAFQQRRSQGWPASRDVARDAREFYRRLRPLVLRYSGTGKGLGWIVDQVQRSYTFNTSHQGRDYQQWREEATIIVNVWSGGSYSASAAEPKKKRQRYVFRRGEPGQGRENSWDCSERLAEEVHWRRWMDHGIFRFASDEYLMESPALITFKRSALPHGVDSVALGDFSTGKRASEFTAEAWLDRWTPPIGTVARLSGYGPTDGAFLLAGLTGNLFSPKVQARYVRPRPALPEPPADAVGSGSGNLTVGSGVGGAITVSASLRGGSISDAWKKAVSIHRKHYPYVFGGGHGRAGVPNGGGYDCSGAVSAVLAAAGILGSHNGQATGYFLHWGVAGHGRHMTIWVHETGDPHASHVFIVFHNIGAGHDVHFGTGQWGKSWGGAGINPTMHPTAGFHPRHWPGT